ncbi:MAG TPA: hypothetical protein VIV09_14425 [Pseudolabrys sp.]
MARPRTDVTDEAFIAAYKKYQSAFDVARHFGLSHAAVWSRRRKIEAKTGLTLPQFDKRAKYARAETQVGNPVFKLEVENGTVLIGSDIHIWPGELTTTQRAFIHFAKLLKPTACILNGDVTDFASISRFPSIGWEHKPTVKQELDAVGDFLGELEKVLGKCIRAWNLGNHDARFENRIAATAPEFSGVKGVHLRDHFDRWHPAWRTDINDDVVVTHRIAGGEHADYNNVIRSGKTTVTGHDHRLGVVPWHDYRGLRWGVRTGYMGESPLDRQFVNYLEAHEPNWHPGFAVLTFRNGMLLWPEIVSKHAEGVVCFRGELVEV